jgi:hypothetical protein
MKSVLIDTKKQEEFELNGYVKFPLLDSETNNILLQYYDELKDKINIQNSIYGIYVSLDEKDRELKLTIMDFLQKSIQPKLDSFLVNYKVHLGGFIVKEPDNFSYTYPHQDWTFVDHEDRESFSATVWISLNDLTPEMGSLGFIKGSQHFLNGIIGSPSTHFRNSTQGHEELLFQYLDFPKVNCGDAIMFNNKCVHGANPNQTPNSRVIIGIGITPKESSLYHYFLKPNSTDTFLKLKVNEDFFMDYMNQDLINTYNDGQVPNNCIVEDEIDLEINQYSNDEMIKMILEKGNIKNDFFIKRPENKAINENIVEFKKVIEIKKVSTYSKIDMSKIINFFRIYTPYNIFKEAKFRLTGKY